LQELLNNPGKFVDCTNLSPISKHVEFEPVAEHGFVRKNINKKFALKKKLRWMRSQSDPENLGLNTPEDNEREFQIAEELLKIESFLSSATFNGKVKHVHNDYDRNRQTVCKAMRLAISYLEKHPDTAHIGQHLRSNTTFGARPRYFGSWTWII